MKAHGAQLSLTDKQYRQSVLYCRRVSLQQELAGASFHRRRCRDEAALGRLSVNGPPASMPALIDEIVRRKGWDKVERTF
jgi:hypothetical protein